MSLLNSNAAHREAALWALQSVISLHPSNQAATVQAGALPKLVGLLDTGPDTAVAEYAADCLCFLAQVTFMLIRHAGMLQITHHCSLILCFKGASAATLDDGLAMLCLLLRTAINICCCPVSDWQFVSIVKVNRESVLQCMLPKTSGLWSPPSVQDS